MLWEIIQMQLSSSCAYYTYAHLHISMCILKYVCVPASRWAGGLGQGWHRADIPGNAIHRRGEGVMGVTVLQGVQA